VPGGGRESKNLSLCQKEEGRVKKSKRGGGKGGASLPGIVPWEGGEELKEIVFKSQKVT